MEHEIMNYKLSPYDLFYNNQIGFCESEIAIQGIEGDIGDCDEAFQSLPSDLQDAMREYFFAGQDTDKANVENIFDYRDTLLEEKPDIATKATEGLRIVAEQSGFPEDAVRALTDFNYFKQRLEQEGNS